MDSRVITALLAMAGRHSCTATQARRRETARWLLAQMAASHEERARLAAWEAEDREATRRLKNHASSALWALKNGQAPTGRLVVLIENADRVDTARAILEARGDAWPEDTGDVTPA